MSFLISRIRIAWALALFTSAATLLTVDAHAANDTPPTPPRSTSFVTFFSFTRYSTDGQQLIAGDDTRPLPVSIPPTFAAWSCTRTPRISKGGTSHQSVICKLGEFETGMGVTCEDNEVSEDSETFWIQRGSGEGKSGVLFVGHCKTIRTVDDGF